MMSNEAATLDFPEVSQLVLQLQVVSDLLKVHPEGS